MIPNWRLVERGLEHAIDGFEQSIPDPRERAAATLALLRRLGALVATRAVNVEGATPRLVTAWAGVGAALLEVPVCELCGGTAVLTAGVESTERGSLPGLAVPCPACGGA